MFNSVFNRIDSFYRKPFKQGGDVLDWLLFIGFVLAAMILWRQVLSQIQED